MVEDRLLKILINAKQSHTKTYVTNRRNYIPRDADFRRSCPQAENPQWIRIVCIEKIVDTQVAFSRLAVASDPPALSGRARSMIFRKFFLTTSSAESRFKLIFKPYTRASSSNRVASARLKRAAGDIDRRRQERISS